MAKKYVSVRDVDNEEHEHEHALTAEERELCQNIVVFGPEYLRHAKGWKKEAIKRFLDRTTIQKEVAALRRQYEDRTGIQERTQFFAQLKINSMVPTAVNLLAKTLRGEYTDSNGNVHQPPSKGQYEAALQVLDRANVQGQKYAGNDSVPAIDARSVHLAIGGTDGGPALDSEGREKVRNVLAAVMGRARAMADADKRIKKGSTDGEAEDADS